MNTHRNNPDSDEMQQADHENRRAAFTAKMEALHEANEPTTPTDGSAVEWVRELLYTADGRNRVLDEDDALELARRADEAETERDAAIQLIKELNATKYQHGRQYRSRCGQFLSTINRNKQ